MKWTSNLQSDNLTLQELPGTLLPGIILQSTNGDSVSLAQLSGCTVIYVYPRTSPPNGKPIDGWDEIPGAKGCTPQSCSFRDHFAELHSAGVDQVYGLSAQTRSYQKEVVERLHLPFELLSDASLKLKSALGLPTFNAGGMILYHRMTMVINEGV
ncbi:MAG: peroxiredoxin, partial [Alphaproteobacteria bacterium]